MLKSNAYKTEYIDTNQTKVRYQLHKSWCNENPIKGMSLSNSKSILEGKLRGYREPRRQGSA